MLPELHLVKTCDACPEQYDVFLEGKQVGYLRLRHGVFIVECGDALVYRAYPKGDGLFFEDERPYYLRMAKEAILRHLAASAAGEI